MSNQIFISYRRTGGDVTAKLICEALKNRGYTVFYDFDALKGGFFDTRILDAIEGCNDVVLVLPPNALDRCVNEDDWVRQEIRHAMAHNKNIIPVMLNGFEFPAELPADIDDIRRYSGLRFLMDYFDAVIDKIIERLTCAPIVEEPKPTYTPEQPTIPAKSRFAIKEARKNGPSLIANVGTIPSNEPQNERPKGTYTSVINTQNFCAVHFHCTLLQKEPFPRTRTVGKYIFDSDDHLVFEEESPILFHESDNRVSFTWIIRDASGMAQKSDTYTFLIWIDDSCAMEYTFRLIDELPKAPPQPSVTVQDVKRDAEIDSITRRLRYPKLWRCSLFAEILLFFAILFFSLDDPDVVGLAVLTLGGGIFFAIRLIKLSAENVFPKHKAAAFFVVFPGLIYYSQYLLVMLIVTLVCKKNWQARLDELSAQKQNT